MKYYQEITILPSGEVPASFILSKVYMQLHIGFAEQKYNGQYNTYGISFPEYCAEKKNILLGSKIRVFAKDENSMQQLNLAVLLERLSDYVHIRKIRAIPDKIKGYSIYKRFRKKIQSAK